VGGVPGLGGPGAGDRGARAGEVTMNRAARPVIATLGLAIAIAWFALPSEAAGKGKVEPRAAVVGRHTVMADRSGGRVGEIARRLAAQDLFLAGWLGVPEARLAQPVTFLYLRRGQGLDRKLPFRGDRIDHRHLVPTDTRLWVVVKDDTGLEDVRSATVQVAEYGLLRGAGNLPAWLSNGMAELLGRLSLEEGQLALGPPSFPALHTAGVSRVALPAVAEPEWNRYREPLRWYTSALVVAYLFDEDRAALTRALADPAGFDLVAEVDTAGFDRWFEGAVAPGGGGARTLRDGVVLPLEVVESDDDTRKRVQIDLALVHPRGPRAFGLGSVEPGAAARVRIAMAEDALEPPCGLLWESDDPEERYLLGLCLADRSPHTAEEILRQLFRADPGQVHAALQVATMVLSEEGREGEARPLLEAALESAPADADAQLLWAALCARAGDCVGWPDDDPRRLSAPWDPLPYASGPLERARDGLVREVLECGAAQ